MLGGSGGGRCPSASMRHPCLPGYRRSQALTIASPTCSPVVLRMRVPSTQHEPALSDIQVLEQMEPSAEILIPLLPYQKEFLSWAVGQV